MPLFRPRQVPGRRALICFALLVLSAASAAAGLRDVRVAGEAPVRSWAARNAPAVEVVRTGGFVTLEGGVQAPWYRVRTTAGKIGWVAGTLTEGLLSADEGLALKPTEFSGSLRLLTPAGLRGGPVGGRPVQHELAAGSIVRVLDQYGTWILLADAQGRSGWAEASTFVASVVPTSATPESEAETRVAESRGAAQAEDELTGAELREQRLAERRAAREAEAAESESEAEARRARKEAARAEALARRQAKEAEELAAKEADAQESLAADADADADDEAAERRAAREAKAAERREAKEAKAAAREAAEAEKRAAREAKAAAKSAEAEVETAPDDEVDAAELKRRERAAKAARKEEERQAEAAAKRAAREAKQAERRAKKEAKKGGGPEPERVVAAAEPVQERPSGPVAPADIPPSLGVSLDKKSPAEKKPDPGRSPLWNETPVTRDPSALPVLDPVVENSRPRDAASAELLEGFQPYDETDQLGRSVDAVHDDPEKALDLSFAERPTARSSDFYVNDQGDMVNTRIVSEIVLRVGSEILTLGEFDRRVAETIEAESVRTGVAPSLDEARRRVMGELVEALVLIHQGRAIGIRFDAVYESAKEDFKNSGGISDDLELLRLLDEMDMTFKDFRREMIRRTVPRLVLRTQVMSDVTVAEDEIDNYYRRHQDEWEEEDCVFLRELVLQPEARETTRDFNMRLEEILKRIEAGEDFCDLARRHSRSPSAAKCGQLGDCFSFEQLDEKVARVVFKMRPGDVEPIRTDWGYHLLRLEEHRPRRVRSFDEVRDSIVRKLQIEKVQGEIPRYLEELLRTVRVEVSPGFEQYWDGRNARGGMGQ